MVFLRYFLVSTSSGQNLIIALIVSNANRFSNWHLKVETEEAFNILNIYPRRS